MRVKIAQDQPASSTTVGGRGAPSLPVPPASSMVVALSTVALTASGALLVGARLAGSQLSLPCPMDQYFGLACPACGMWRGATALARGDAAGITEQASAIAVGLMLAAGAAVSIGAWLRRRWPSARFSRWFAVAIGLALSVNWVVQLARVW